MKSLTSIALILLLCSCQKEIMFPTEPEAVIVKEEPPKEVNYREEPSQQIIMSDFAPMLWENRQYTITEYYSVKKDLWSDLPGWIKDDVYTFQETGDAWVDAGAVQNPAFSFETIKESWKLYADADDNMIKLEWLNDNYEFKKYTLVAYEAEKSFTLSTKVNDSKVFITYTLLK